MGDSHPYCAEYAKSSRSKCRGCPEKIEHGVLRIGLYTHSQLTFWFHKDCFFKRHKPASSADIANFGRLKPDDKAFVKANIGVEAAPVEAQPPPVEADDTAPVESGDDENEHSKKAEKKKPAAKKKAKGTGSKSMYMVDYSLSARATCCSCHEKIDKSIVRIARMDYTSNKGRALEGIPRWYHVKCFVSNRDFFHFFDSAKALPGFHALQQEDQKKLLEELPEENLDKATEEGASGWKLMQIDEHNFKKLKQNLDDINMKDLTSILKHNKQTVPKQPRKQELVDLITVLARYGVAGKCPDCNSNSLVEKDKLFVCSTEPPCGFQTNSPPLVELKIPKKIRDENEFLKNFDFKIRDRDVEMALAEPPKVQLNANAPEFQPGTQQTKPKGRLQGMEFAVWGDKSLKEHVKRLGGRIVTFIDRRTKALVTDEETMRASRDAKDKRLHFVEQHFTPIVGIEFLEAAEFGNRNVHKLVKEHDMAGDWLYDIDDIMNETYGPWGRR